MVLFSVMLRKCRYYKVLPRVNYIFSFGINKLPLCAGFSGKMLNMKKYTHTGTIRQIHNSDNRWPRMMEISQQPRQRCYQPANCQWVAPRLKGGSEEKRISHPETRKQQKKSARKKKRSVDIWRGERWFGNAAVWLVYMPIVESRTPRRAHNRSSKLLTAGAKYEMNERRPQHQIFFFFLFCIVFASYINIVCSACPFLRSSSVLRCPHHTRFSTSLVLSRSKRQWISTIYTSVRYGIA